MKKHILLIALLLTAIVRAQDTNTINQLVNASSLDQVKNTSDKIIKGFESKPYFYKIKESKRNESEVYQNVYYFPNDVVLNNNQPTDEQKSQSIKVNFGQYYLGENKDLGNKGELVYYFREVYGSYLDLIDFWITTFYPNNTKEEILSNYKLQEFRVNKDVKFRLVKDSDLWKIYKSY